MPADRAWDDEVDLLVIGAGAAGMSCALAAAIEHPEWQVLLCEKSAQVGGTTARSSGGVWVPGHPRASTEPPQRVQDYLGALMTGTGQAAHRAAYLHDAPRALAWLEANSALRFAPLDHPDYHDAPGAGQGRSMGAVPFDGRRLGRDFDALAAPLPSLVALGGMMVGRADIPHLLRPWRSWDSLRITAGLIGRYLHDRLRHRRGTRLLMGNALAAALFLRLKECGVTLWREAPAIDLIRKNGRVGGALVRHGGMQRRVRARQAVVLATGGFSHSPEWRERLMTDAERRALSLACEGSTGDGLAMAEGCGAEVSRGALRSACVWSPVSALQRPGRAPLVYPHLFLDRPKPGFIAVDRAGRRFVNEASSYHDFTQGMLRAPGTASEGRAWLICDSVALRQHGIGLVLPGARNAARLRRAGYLAMDDAIEGLARRLGIDAEGLADEVRRFNLQAQAGVDADFGKGASHFNRFHGDAAHMPNPCLAPIAVPPFVAVELRPADLSSFAGIRTDANARVLDAKGEVIEGLYACGNDMASIWEGKAPGPGVTLGPAIVFGWRAGMHIAQVEASREQIE